MQIKYIRLMSLLMGVGMLAVHTNATAKSKNKEKQDATARIVTTVEKAAYGLPRTAPYDIKRQQLYLGASGTGAKDAALIGVKSSRDPVLGTNSVAGIPLVPTPVLINANPTKQPNPLNSADFDQAAGAGLSNVTLGSDGRPVVTHRFDPEGAFFITDAVKGSSFLVNASSDAKTQFPIHDATGAANVGRVHAMAASQENVVYNSTGASAPFIFEAVSDNNTWDKAADATRGIAVVRVDENVEKRLIAEDAKDFSKKDLNNKAVHVNFSNANDPDGNSPIVAIGAPAVPGAGAKVNMTWDDTLGRLYVAQTQLESETPSNKNAEAGIFLGKMVQGATGSFQLFPIIDLTKGGAIFDTSGVPDNIRKGIFGGFTDNGGFGAVANLRLPRIMHTSTGKDYLIIVGGVESTPVRNVASNTWVNALPLVGSGANAGMLAQINDLTKPLDVLANAPLLDRTEVDPVLIDIPPTFSPNEKKVAVGADPRLIGGVTTNQDIFDMQVVGDTVYVAVAGNRLTAGVEAGVFKSTALFDSNGLIRTWTPWQRAVGATTPPVATFGFDENDANSRFLNFDGSTVEATAWGTSAHVADAGASRKLTDILSGPTLFPPANEGLYRVFNFDEKTLGLPANIAFAVAIGDQKVALIVTGDVVAGNIKPTSNFKKSVLPVSSAGLTQIAPLTFVEFSREAVTKNAFIGGSQGLAVAPFATIKNPVAVPDWTGRNIVALGSDGTQLNVLAIDKFAVTDFSGKVIDNKSVEFDCTKFATDMVVVESVGATTNDPNLAIIATTAGLFFTSDDGATFTQVSDIEGTPLQLQYLSETRGVNSRTGNLLVLTGDRAKNQGRIYRFDVNASAPLAADRIKLIPTANGDNFLDLESFRGSFSADGGALLSAWGRGTDNNTLLQVHHVSDGGLGDDLTPVMDVTDSNVFINVPTLDTSSGGFIVPGDFAARVNE